MNSFFKLRELIGDRDVRLIRHLSQNNFSYIVFLLNDNSSIVVVRRLHKVKEKLCSQAVVDIVQDKQSFQIILESIQQNNFIFKEKTDVKRINTVVPIKQDSEKTTSLRKTLNRLKTHIGSKRCI
jgi:hypothetical protein